VHTCPWLYLEESAGSVAKLGCHLHDTDVCPLDSLLNICVIKDQ
jgi:hypothetical protein